MSTAVEVSGIQPLGVETAQESTGKPLKLWARVGWDGAFVLCFLYTVAGVHLYLAFLYTNEFRSFARGPVFVFFFFALFVVLVASKSPRGGGGGIAVARLKVNHFFKVVAFMRTGRWREDDDACTIILPSVNIEKKKR